MKKICLVFVVLLTAAGAAFPQDPGVIKRAGNITLLRTGGKIPDPVLGTLDTTMDMVSGGFTATDSSKLPPPGDPADITIIGTCKVAPIVIPAPGTVDDNRNATTSLDAGPVLNITG